MAAITTTDLPEGMACSSVTRTRLLRIWSPDRRSARSAWAVRSVTSRWSAFAG